jgi:hypothetical protein
MFSFGMTTGAILQGLICQNFVVNHVEPRQWRKDLQVRKGKDGSMQRASELLPQHIEHWKARKHNGRAEAALIALYGLNRQPPFRRRLAL